MRNGQCVAVREARSCTVESYNGSCSGTRARRRTAALRRRHRWSSPVRLAVQETQPPRPRTMGISFALLQGEIWPRRRGRCGV